MFNATEKRLAFIIDLPTPSNTPIVLKGQVGVSLLGRRLDASNSLENDVDRTLGENALLSRSRSSLQVKAETHDSGCAIFAMKKVSE